MVGTTIGSTWRMGGVATVEGGGGKTTPCARGIFEEGFSAVPKTMPMPGKLPEVDFSAVTEAATADLAWCSAALILSRDCRAGPRRRFVL